MDQRALGRRRVLDSDHDGGQDALPDAGRAEEIGRRDLLQVGEDRGRALRAVDGEARDDGLRVGEDVVPHPGHRQIRQDFLVLAKRLEVRRVARGRDQIAVRQHRALGRAGGARRVADDGDVVRATPGELGVEVRRVAHLKLLSELGELDQAQQPGLAVAAHPARIVVDDVLQAAAAGSHAQELVDLLLILDDGEASLGVLDDVLHLALDGVLVDRHRDTAQCLRGHHRPVELRAVVADDRDAVAAREAERGQAQRDQASLLEVPRPGIGLPDPEVFLSDGDLVGTTPRVITNELRERIALGIERRRAGTLRDCLQIASATHQR